MADKGKSSLLIVVAFALISLAGACVGFYLFQKERAVNSALQEQLEEVKTAQRVSETKLEESTKRISELETKRKEAEGQIDMLNRSLQEEKTAKEQALTQIQQVRADLEEQKKLRSDLEKKFDQAQMDVKRVQTQLRDLDSRKSELEQKVNELEAKAQSNVELGTIVVAPESTASQKAAKPKKEKPEKKAAATSAVPAAAPAPAAPAASGPEGKVLVVNKDYNFVVINMGSKDGVTIGAVFSIFHNNKYVGDAKVEKVHDSMAAAGFLTQGIRDKISEGDKIVLKK